MSQPQRKQPPPPVVSLHPLTLDQPLAHALGTPRPTCVVHRKQTTTKKPKKPTDGRVERRGQRLIKFKGVFASVLPDVPRLCSRRWTPDGDIQSGLKGAGCR